jgi:hypothetical protein
MNRQFIVYGGLLCCNTMYTCRKIPKRLKPLKHWGLPTSTQSDTSQNTSTVIFTAMRISNVTQVFVFMEI